jgi:hypothetical protein
MARVVVSLDDPPCRRQASAYYDEFVRPQGGVNLIATGFARGPDSFALLALTRSPGAAWVEPPGWHLLETLAPHLARAAAVHALLARSRARANALSAATGFAVFPLNATCRVLFANAKAEDLMRRQTGLRYEGGRLAAATPALTQRLQELARAGSWPGRGGGEIGGTIELPRGENRPPLLAHVIPLAASRAASVFDIERPAAAVFVVDLVAEMHAQIARFAAKFGLTLAEARLLGKIIGGSGLLTACDRVPARYACAWDDLLSQCPAGVKPFFWETAIYDSAALFGCWGAELARLRWTPGNLFDVSAR